MTETVLSAGIDVGTSTTEVVFSRLTIENMAGAFTVPRVEIINKEIIYRSQVHVTPLQTPTRIDTARLTDIVRDEYRQAGIEASQVGTGAAIITGETARAENAEELLSALSALAGDFVVATAGPRLESILAARGVGIDELSKNRGGIVANLDVGGGTTNIAAYRRGGLLGASCLEIGGRLVRIEDGLISYVSPSIDRLADGVGITLTKGSRADTPQLEALCSHMARHLAAGVGLRPRDELHQHLYTNAGPPLEAGIVPDMISFSGGVSDLVSAEPPRDPFQYGDLGVLLGRAIAREPAFDHLARHRGIETIAATVVGAGVHTTEISGSTIDYAADVLPVRNIPIVQIPDAVQTEAPALAAAIREQLRIVHPEDPQAAVALSLSGAALNDFASVQQTAEAIMQGAREVLAGPNPLVVVLEEDRAKVLGQSIASRRGHNDGVICIDSVHTSHGDYIDIGRPVGSGQAVPVVVKTLVFNDSPSQRPNEFGRVEPPRVG